MRKGAPKVWSHVLSGASDISATICTRGEATRP